MQAWFLQLGTLFVHIMLAIMLVGGVARFSRLLFKVDLVREIERDNRSAAYFLGGVCIMVGLVVGLFSL